MDSVKLLQLSYITSLTPQKSLMELFLTSGWPTPTVMYIVRLSLANPDFIPIETSHYSEAGAFRCRAVYRLDAMIQDELEIPVDDSIFWTDSTCVIRYIENEENRFTTFVANRVAAIREQSLPKQ